MKFSKRLKWPIVKNTDQGLQEVVDLTAHILSLGYNGCYVKAFFFFLIQVLINKVNYKQNLETEKILIFPLRS